MKIKTSISTLIIMIQCKRSNLPCSFLLTNTFFCRLGRYQVRNQVLVNCIKHVTFRLNRLTFQTIRVDTRTHRSEL